MRSRVMMPVTLARQRARRRRCAGIEWDARRCCTPVGCRIGTPSRACRPRTWPSPVAVNRQAWQSVSTTSPAVGLSPICSHPWIAVFSATATAGAPHAMPVDTRWHCRWATACEVDPRSRERCRSRHLLSDAPNAGQRRRRPAFDAAAMVFARRWTQQAIVEIGQRFIGFLPFVVMALRGDQRSHLVHRHATVARLCANAYPVQDRLHLLRPSAEPAFTDVG